MTGFWVAGLALVLLLTGLPWADVWGTAFKLVREQAGLVSGAQDWTIGGRAAEPDHAGHDHAAMMAGAAPTASMTHMMPDGSVMTMAMPRTTLTRMVAVARSEQLAFPVIVLPPGTAKAGGSEGMQVWTVRSEAQNCPQRVTLRYDAATGAELSREVFADKHPIDQAIGYGIA